MEQTAQNAPAAEGEMLSATSCRRAAAMMNWGNLVAILIPIPFLILWFGASMLVYAMHRHHPNPRVGYFTQHAAYRFYAVAGFFTAVAAFFPGGGSGAWWMPYLISWGLAILVLVPWSIVDLVKIYREPWVDCPVPDQGSGRRA